jgi:hypothetical protein
MQSGNIEIYFATMQCLKYLIDNTVTQVSNDIKIQSQSIEKSLPINDFIATEVSDPIIEDFQDVLSLQNLKETEKSLVPYQANKILYKQKKSMFHKTLYITSFINLSVLRCQKIV